MYYADNYDAQMEDSVVEWIRDHRDEIVNEPEDSLVDVIVSGMRDDRRITNYFSSFDEARDMVMENMPYLIKAVDGWSFAKVGKTFLDEYWTVFDAAIRQYLLPEIVEEVLNESGDELLFDEDAF